MNRISQRLGRVTLIVALILTALPGPADSQDSKIVDAAKKEGKLVFWSSDPAPLMEQVLGKFRQRYPFLATEYWRAGSAERHQKQVTEKSAGVYNVDVAGTDLEFIVDLRKLGLMKKHSWPNTAVWPAYDRDPEGYWVTRLRSTKVVAYNTQLVSPAEVPNSWNSLLDPKWKGKIQIDRHSADWVLMLWSAWGKEKAVSFLKTLAPNAVLSGNQSQRIELLAAGGATIDMAISMHRIVQYQDKGAPLAFAKVNPTVLEKSTPMYIADRAPHPNAAILFADWFTSTEGQQIYHDVTFSPIPDPKVRSRLTDAMQGLSVAATPVTMMVHSNEAEKLFRDIFLR
jgi:iron(III) transport system substrate-binding protein